MTFNIDTVQTQVEAAGLTVRGAFHPGPDDAAPSMLDGTTPGTLVVLGNAGFELVGNVCCLRISRRPARSTG